MSPITARTRRTRTARAAAFVSCLTAAACTAGADAPGGSMENAAADPSVEARVAQYATVRLSSDLSHLSDADRRVVRLLIEAAEPMHEAFWMEAWGSRDSLMAMIDDETGSTGTRRSWRASGRSPRARASTRRT
jgi:hypothetical protein